MYILVDKQTETSIIEKTYVELIEIASAMDIYTKQIPFVRNQQMTQKNSKCSRKNENLSISKEKVRSSLHFQSYILQT